MKQSKLFWCLALLLAALAVLGTATLALENMPQAVSPGVEVLARRLSVLKTGTAGQEVVFTNADFEKALGTLPASVTVQSLPPLSKGVLKLGAVDVTVGEVIGAQNYKYLRFVPSGSREDTVSFTFTAENAAYDTALCCKLFLLAAENAAPTAKSVTVFAYENIAAPMQLSARDKDGDSVFYTVEKQPGRGTVAVDYLTGTAVYTPSRAGDDSFSFTVQDSYGNRSAEAVVTVHTEERKANVVYADMTTHWALSAATAMAEHNLLIGDSVNGVSLFRPEGTISRGDFLMAALQAAGLEDALPTDGRSAGFDDDTGIPAHVMKYAAYAKEAGILCGVEADGKMLFEASRAITREEACAIVARLLPDTVKVAAMQQDTAVFATTAPAGSAEAVLAGAGVLTAKAAEPGAVLCRAQAAVMLAALLHLA